MTHPTQSLSLSNLSSSLTTTTTTKQYLPHFLCFLWSLPILVSISFLFLFSPLLLLLLLPSLHLSVSPPLTELSWVKLSCSLPRPLPTVVLMKLSSWTTVKTASKKWLLSDTNPSSPESQLLVKANKTLSLVRKTTIFWSLNPVWLANALGRSLQQTREGERRERKDALHSLTTLQMWKGLLFSSFTGIFQEVPKCRVKPS